MRSPPETRDVSLSTAGTALRLNRFDLCCKCSGVFWLLLQRSEVQKEANLYQRFAVSLDSLILAVNNKNTQALPVQGAARKANPS